MKIFPIFIPYSGCPQRCIYCNQSLITKSPSQQSGNEFFEPDLTLIFEQLSQFCRKYGKQDIEIAFYGGSFTLLPEAIQHEYLHRVKTYLPDNAGIRISTRPDGINESVLSFCKLNRVKTIELGIQSFSDEVLKKSKRSYTKQQAVESSELIKKHGIKLGIQLMPGLPGFTEESLRQTIAETIRIKPEVVRIYPTVVIKDTVLEKLYRQGDYNPLTLDDAVDICVSMITQLEKNSIKVIKTGLHSDLSATREAVVAGPYHPSFGELVKKEMLYRDIAKKYSEVRTDHQIINNKVSSQVTLLISRGSVSLIMGNKKELLERLKKLFCRDTLKIEIDNKLTNREFQLSVK